MNAHRPAVLILLGAALAAQAQPPSLDSAHCTDASIHIAVARKHPYAVPAEFRGTPWEAVLKRKDDIERAEARRQFVRDCVPHGYRVPENQADEDHNKAVMRRQAKEFEKQFEAAMAAAARNRNPAVPPRTGAIPPVEPGEEETALVECGRSWIHQVGLPRHVRDQVGGSDGRTYGASLAFRCGKYGFVDARDDAADEINRRAWEGVNDRVAGLKKARGDRMMQEILR